MCGESPELPVRAFTAGPPTRSGFRSYFAGARGSAAPLPAHVDLRAFDGPVRDQGQVGVCWAHALSSVIDNGARQSGHQHAAVSALHAVAKDSWDDLYKQGPSQALTLEGQWPYHPPKACAFNEEPSEVWCEREYGVKPASWRQSPQLVAELRHADALPAFRFDNVEKLAAKPGNPQELASVLASGRAIWADVAFSRRAWSYSNLKGGVFPDYEPDRNSGHAVVIVGFRTVGSSRQFLIKNSWGDDWAQGGYAWMPEHALARHLRQAFVLRVVPSAGVPNQPVPVPQPGGQPGGQPGAMPLPPLAGLPPWLNGLPQLLPKGLPVPSANTVPAGGVPAATWPATLPPTTGLPDPCALTAGLAPALCPR